MDRGLAHMTRAEPATPLPAWRTALSGTFRNARLPPWPRLSLQTSGRTIATHREAAARTPSSPRYARHWASWRKWCSPGSCHQSAPSVQSGHLSGRRHEAVGRKITNAGNETATEACHECGTADSRNRKSQAEFLCVACGHADNADLNASANMLASERVCAARRVCIGHLCDS